jgi:hypothetical protein
MIQEQTISTLSNVRDQTYVLLINRREQWPSNRDDLDSSATGKVERELCGGKLSSDFTFVP